MGYFDKSDREMVTLIARGGEAVDISSADHQCKFPTCSIYARTGGDIKLGMADGTELTLIGVANQTHLRDICAKTVAKTGTTAAGMVVFWG